MKNTFENRSFISKQERIGGDGHDPRDRVDRKLCSTRYYSSGCGDVYAECVDLDCGGTDSHCTDEICEVQCSSDCGIDVRVRTKCKDRDGDVASCNAGLFKRSSLALSNDECTRLIKDTLGGSGSIFESGLPSDLRTRVDINGSCSIHAETY